MEISFEIDQIKMFFTVFVNMTKRRGHQRVAPMEERNETMEGERWQKEKVAKKRPSLRQVVEEYGLKVCELREKPLEIKKVQFQHKMPTPRCLTWRKRTCQLFRVR